MSGLLPLPTPTPRGHISPSGACGLLRCPLSVAFADDPAYPGRNDSSPALILGTVAHAILEAAAKGKVASMEDASRLWDSELERALSKCPESAHWPAPSEWHSYSLKKSRALKHSVRIGTAWGGRGERGHAGAGGTGGGGAELSLSALNGLIEGRIDLLSAGPPRVIEDYKTGAVRDAVGGMKEDFRVQLLLYAVLDNATSGHWPDKARAVPLVGQPEEIDVDPAEAQAVLNAVTSALSDYRAAVASGAVDQLARPSPSACSRCDYRVDCRFFWAAAEPAWAAEGIVAVSGTVLSSVDTGSLVGLRLRAEAGTVEGDITIEAFPRDNMPPVSVLEGKRVVVDGLQHKRESALTLRASQWSVLEILGD